MTPAAADTVRDTLHALLSGTISVADSVRLAGQLNLVQPQTPSPGWFEQWGIPALVNVLAVGLLGLFVQSRLQKEQLGHQAILALFTHRAGALSQVQLRATRRIWKSAVGSALALQRLGSPIKSVPANDSATHLRLLRTPARELAQLIAKADQEEAKRVYDENHAAAVHLEEERAFLPAEVYNMAADYFAAVQSAAELAWRRAQGEKELANELATLLSDKVYPLYEQLSGEIRRLTTPRLQTSPS